MVAKTHATVEDLYNAPDDGKYELVEGRLVASVLDRVPASPHCGPHFQRAL